MQNYYQQLFKIDMNMVSYINKTDIECILHKILETIDELKEKDKNKLTVCMIVEYYLSMMSHAQINDGSFNKLKNSIYEINQLKQTFDQYVSFSSYQEQIKENYSEGIRDLVNITGEENLRKLCLMIYRLYCDDLFPSYNCDDLVDINILMLCMSICETDN